MPWQILSSLTSLQFRECGLNGEFPINIFAITSLQFRSVRNNPDMTGYLPEFRKTNPLRFLSLVGTSFSAKLLASIGKLGSLTELDISSCNFMMVNWSPYPATLFRPVKQLF